MYKSLLRRVLFPILVVIVGVPAWAQSGGMPGMPKLGTIRGVIRTQDGRPAPLGIPVYLEQRGGGTAGSTQTDRSGKFEFEQIPATQPYEVVVRAQGYVEIHREVDLGMMTQAYLDLTLQPDRRSLGFGGPQPASGSISALDAKAPENARKNVEDGQAILASGKDLDKSIGLFKKATETYPQYVQAYLLMGVAYSSEKKWDEAEKPLRKAIELDKASAPAYIALGAVQNEKHNFADAEKNLRRATEIAPDSPDAHFELGRAFYGQSNWDGADTELAKAIQLRPDHSGEHLLRGNVLLRKRDGAGALAEFKESVRLDPKGPFADPTNAVIQKLEEALKSAKK